MPQKVEWRSFIFGLFTGVFLSVCVLRIQVASISNFYEVMSVRITNRVNEAFQSPLTYPAVPIVPGKSEQKQTNMLEYPLQVYDDSLARDVAQKIRILCWVMTGSKNHHKAKVVRDTWGRRCNLLLFFSDVEDPSVPTIELADVHTGHNHLWGKTKQGFEYIHKNFLDDYDWFFKVDDDTFLIPENARFMLSRFDPNDPLWFGCKFKPYVKGGYNSGGAGYVLSREAVRRFIEKSLAVENEKNCRLQDDQGAEDVEIGRCLESVGVKNGDSRDEYGRGRFFPFGPGDFTDVSNMTVGYWYWNYIFYKNKQGPDCCSETAISFHYIDPHNMRMLDYLIYTLYPYGINTHYQSGITAPPPPDEKLEAAPWIGVDEEYKMLVESKKTKE